MMSGRQLHLLMASMYISRVLKLLGVPKILAFPTSHDVPKWQDHSCTKDVVYIFLELVKDDYMNTLHKYM